MSEAAVTVMPIINMNGSSKASLMEQYRFVMKLAKEATEAACVNAPHGRDYQCNRESDAYQKAHDEYNEMVIKKLAEATAYLEKLLIGLSDQKG